MQSETDILAFVTENGRTKSRDADTTATKDGSVRTIPRELLRQRLHAHPLWQKVTR